MSYLEKLLDGVEVEWRNLGDTSLFEIANNGRKPVKASLRIAGETPYYGANNIQDYVDGYTHDGEYVLIAEDGSASLENYSIQYATGKFWANNHVHVVRGKERVHSRFLYHYLCIVNFLPFLTGGGRAKLTKGQLIEIPVPIPCPDNPEKSLAIQSEIVRILDKFTALTAELTAELNMRKKQYNYYRDQLLSFKEGEVEWKTLGEVAVIGTGNHDTQDAIEHGKYIFYARGREPLKLNVFDFDETAIITAGDGAGVGKVFHYAKGKYALHQRAYRIVPNAFMNPRFVYHYITAYFFTYIQKASVSSSVTSLRRPMFLKFPIPVPPSEEQARIVEILDKFDTLTNSITEGLPREIELRQKQYEYYRDLLFSFPRPETASN
ncbi:restriction endonuclease subunit S [Citrobacter freundii]|uniref:Type I restriction-modification system, specificity subunit S n=2 Tax=Enterobacteriaceae TaxID=543 RepID=A0A7G2IYH2_CITFR|nr:MULTISPECIES: restriction endonuclease subunit S [Citrobacter]MDQ9465500.1 restriction endonuclease subunit S [Citrobacter freundii]MDU1875012.1 restriction endonuclease subunit S [Citrobacter sp.]MDV1144937.1 restriction endonuclease subunit S [Citrobacter freundii]MDV1165123.1 restriction endonuclease subunit S [Citrobacter freundii]MDV1169288.1 restriction endonuclease subunit S [Citrobacter freundii]